MNNLFLSFFDKNDHYEQWIIIFFIDRINRVIAESKIKYIRIINIEKKDLVLKDSINIKPAIYPMELTQSHPEIFLQMAYWV